MAKTLKAWHIVHYDELFRAKDTGGRVIMTVKYAQDIMAGGDEYSSQHLIRMQVLEAELGFELFVMAKHLFMQMLKHSHRLSGEKVKYRGYILDERLRSPGPAKIATLCRCPAKLVQKCLPALQRVGLIERADLPGAAPEKDPPPSDEPKKKAVKKKKKTTAKSREKAAGGGKKGHKKAAQTSGGSSTTPLSPKDGGSSATSFKKGKGKDKTRPSASEDQEKNKVGLSASKGPAAAAPSRAGQNQSQTQDDGNGAADAAREATGQAAKPNAESKAESKGNLGPELDRIMGSVTRTALSPTTTPPIADVPSLPCETDAGAGEAEARLVRLTSLQRKLANPERFADLIYAGIREPHSKDSPQGAREYGVFFAFWQKVRQRRLSIDVMDVIWNKCVESAERIGRKRDKIVAGKRRGKAGSPGAVWRYEANKRLANPLGKDAGKHRLSGVK